MSSKRSRALKMILVNMTLDNVIKTFEYSNSDVGNLTQMTEMTALISNYFFQD